MTLFTNHKAGAVLRSVEFTPALDGNFSFFHVKDEASVAAAREKLTSLGQQVISETTVAGSPMLVTRGNITDYSLLGALAADGNNFQKPKEEKGIKPWKLRGWASMIGQPLQLVSAFMTKPNGIDSATAGFATLNIIANISNIAFGAEKSHDTHQLQYLKRQFNYELSKHLPGGASSSLPSSYDNRMQLRAGKEEHPSLGTRAYNFLKRHSVSFCEIGLRYLGSIILVFPMNKWREGMSAFGDSLKNSAKGGYVKALAEGASAAFNKKDLATAYVGIGYVAGKSLALASKVPDPYDPKPHTALDTFREKIAFRASSVIEAVAAGWLAYDRLFKRTVGYTKVAKALEPAVNYIAKETPHWLTKMKDPSFRTRDWFGGVGGALFTSGLIIRVFAKYGSKEVDMNELNAHLVDGLSQLPPERLPKLIADFSAFLTDHFKGKVKFGEVYKELTDQLYKYHQIALPHSFEAAHEQSAMLASAQAAVEAARKTPQRTFASDDLKKSATTITTKPRPSSHKDAVVATARDGIALGL